MKRGLINYILILVLVVSMLLAGCGDTVSSASSLDGQTTALVASDTQTTDTKEDELTTVDNAGTQEAEQAITDDAGAQEVEQPTVDNAGAQEAEQTTVDDAGAQEAEQPTADDAGIQENAQTMEDARSDADAADQAGTASSDSNPVQPTTEPAVSAPSEEVVTETVANDVNTASPQDNQVASVPVSALTPAAGGTAVKGNSYVTIDISNAAQGYIVVKYLGSSSKVKLQLTGPNGVTYTYTISNAQVVIPLSVGSGTYRVGCYENISGNSYAQVYLEDIAFNITNTFGPFLYPNYYVNFNANSAAVAKAQNLVAGAGTDLDRVKNIYDYVTQNITYDYNKAATVGKGYIPNVDSTLATGTGICFDYAALMTAMLRSQGIPTRLEVGYAGDAYHAWISTYIADVGWINGIIEFKGNTWTLMDPTFAANSSESALRNFIGNGSNYTVKYMY